MKSVCMYRGFSLSLSWIKDCLIKSVREDTATMASRLVEMIKQVQSCIYRLHATELSFWGFSRRTLKGFYSFY